MFVNKGISFMGHTVIEIVNLEWIFTKKHLQNKSVQFNPYRDILSNQK